MGKEKQSHVNNKLLRKVAKGDSIAITKLLKALTAQTKSSLIGMGLDARDVEEAILDAMTLFIEKVKTGKYTDQGVPVMAYLSKSAKYRAYYYLRRKNSDIVPLPDEIIPDLPLKADFAKWDLILTALQKLEPKYRRLIELTYIEGFSDREIKERQLSLFSTVDSIKTQRYKSIRKLVEALENLKQGR